MTDLKYITVTANLASPRGKKSIPFVKDGYTLFFNAQHLLIELTANERALYDYLCEQMISRDNSLTVDTKMKQAFITHITEVTIGKHSPSSKSVTGYVNKLAALGLLILTGSKKSELYCVNPKYAFKGSAAKRIALLKRLIEERNKNGLTISMLLNNPL